MHASMQKALAITAFATCARQAFAATCMCGSALRATATPSEGFRAFPVKSLRVLTNTLSCQRGMWSSTFNISTAAFQDAELLERTHEVVPERDILAECGGTDDLEVEPIAFPRRVCPLRRVREARSRHAIAPAEVRIVLQQASLSGVTELQQAGKGARCLTSKQRICGS